MTVGETLTEARNQAGLSVDELSERTRIRGTVIRSIEEDDYAACGGDLYVRGYVRAIAGAVGIDAQPLIREYDLGRPGGPNERASGSTGRHATGYPSPPPRDTAPTSFDLPAIPETPPAHVEPAPAEDLNTTRFDMPAVAPDPATTSFDLPRVSDVVPTTAFLAAEIPAAEVLAAEIPVAEPPTTELPLQVTPTRSAPPAAVPPGNADTRYDLPPIPADPTQVSPEDFMPALYAAPTDAAAGTQVLPAVDFDPSPAEATAAWAAAEPTAAWPASEATTARPAPAPGDPGQAGPPPVGTAPGGNSRNWLRGLLAVAAGLVVLAAAGFGISQAMGNTSTTNTAAAPSTNASAKASQSAAAQTR
ncbi:MAG TPA: helix-turn-helix domain-containing protein, partial [Trebonia sp.]|nr:helix-turn-helix domain-containing protein [Trebonia sp.]